MDEALLSSTPRQSIFGSIRSSHLLRRDVPVTSIRNAIGWWESRRIPFNLIVGSAGILTCICCAVVLVAASILDPSEFDMGSPLVGPILILLYGALANICYTGGWVAELVIRKLWPHEADRFATSSWFLGVVFSALLTLAPAVVFLLAGLFGLGHHFLRPTHAP
jgi:hypothetical protein